MTTAEERPDLDAVFEMAAQAAKESGTGLSQSDKLRLYSLFKQATVGDCNIPKPGFFDMTGRAKWGAWEHLKGMSQLEAKEGYVTAVDELVASKGAAPSSSEAEAGEDDTSSSASSKSSALGPVMSIMANAAAEEEPRADDIWKWASEGAVAKLKQAINADTAGTLGARDSDGASLLHIACDRGDVSMAQLLIQKGASPNETDNDRSTPLHYAAICGHEAVVQALLQAGADKNAVNSDGERPADVADASVQKLLA